jgi:hypothetical protein
MITPILKFFNSCTEGELIRFTEAGQTHWAIVGARSDERLMLLVLPLNSPPYCENILGAMDLLRPPLRRNASLVLWKRLLNPCQSRWGV